MSGINRLSKLVFQGLFWLSTHGHTDTDAIMFDYKTLTVGRRAR